MLEWRNLPGYWDANTDNEAAPEVQCGYCLPSEGRIPGNAYLVAGEESWYQLCHSRVVENIRRHGAPIALREAGEPALLPRVPI